jgi:predicted transcriptional regulator
VDASVAWAWEFKGKGISASNIGKMLGVSRPPVYRYLLQAARRVVSRPGNIPGWFPR